MTLLPDVERELLRVAHQPLAPRGDAGRPTRPRSARRGGAIAVAASVAALLVAVVFLVTLHRTPAHPGIPSSQLAPGPTFPGAPPTQPGPWEGGNTVCPLAAPNQYLPPRSGCVSVLRVDVDGDGRPDLVLLYAHLGHHSFGGRYPPTSFTLEVVRASGSVVRARLPRPEFNAALVESGNVNGVPGAELFIQVVRISSGSAGEVYTFHDGRLIRERVTLGWGGDSATKAGFACRPGRPPTLIVRTFELQGLENGRWQQTQTVFAWHGAVLERISHSVTHRQGVPPAAQTSLGTGCGTIDRATTS